MSIITDKYINIFYNKTDTFFNYLLNDTVLFIDEIGKIKARIDNIKNDSNILVVAPEKDIKAITKLKIDKNIRMISNTTTNTSYPAQVNIGVKEVKTEYFSILSITLLCRRRPAVSIRL